FRGLALIKTSARLEPHRMSTNDSPSSVSRRLFLGTAGAAAATVAWTARSYAAIKGANDRIRIGFIGAGGMANSHMDAFNASRDEHNLETVAVADCWQTRAEA